jgi:uncharacterized protein YfdQ (DUF2303 family)
MSTEHTEAGAVAEIVKASVLVNGQPLDDAPLILVREVDRDGTSVVKHVDLEPYLARPARKKGDVVLTDPESFTTYVIAHTDPGSRLYADLEQVQIVAVLNDDPNGEADEFAGWGDHRAYLKIKREPAWDRWRKNDGKLLSQSDFAEHLELSLPEIVDPPSADLVEIARTFTASTNTNFRSAQRLDNGEVQFRYEQTVTANAGQVGEIAIPQTFTIRLPLFMGGEPLELTARLRYRLDDGTLRIGYYLLNPLDAELAAFQSIVDKARDDTSLPTLYGTPLRRPH